jgi:uncharacterized lipoprotein YbaY
MKKFVTLVIAAAFGSVLLTGCAKKEEAVPAMETATEAPAVVEETATTETVTTTTEAMPMTEAPAAMATPPATSP